MKKLLCVPVDSIFSMSIFQVLKKFVEYLWSHQQLITIEIDTHLFQFPQKDFKHGKGNLFICINCLALSLDLASYEKRVTSFIAHISTCCLHMTTFEPNNL